MKKIIFLFVVIGLVLTFSSAVFAAETFTNTGNANVSDIMADFKTSKNVTLISTAGLSSYAAVSSHLNGGKVYGSSSGDALIFTLDNDKTAGTAYTTEPSSSDSGEFTSGWTAK